MSGHKREDNICVTTGNEPVHCVKLSEYLNYLKKEIITRQADCDKPIYLCKSYVLSCGPFSFLDKKRRKYLRHSRKRARILCEIGKCEMSKIYCISCHKIYFLRNKIT